MARHLRPLPSRKNCPLRQNNRLSTRRKKAAKKNSQRAKQRVPLPCGTLQHAIVAHIGSATAKLDGLRAAAERTIALLKERRAAIIAAAVTGKIAVPTRPASVKTGAPYEN